MMADYYNPGDTHKVLYNPEEAWKHLEPPGLEVGPAPVRTFPPEVVPPPRDDEKFANDSDTALTPEKRGILVSRRRIYIAIAVTIIVIIAVVAGAVAGVLAHNKKSHAATTPAANATSSEDIRNDSAIAVTGWKHNDSQWSVRLFYQDGDGFLRIASLESTDGEVWSGGTKFVKAKAGTPLAASSFNMSWYNDTESYMETHVFYLDDNGILQEFIFKKADRAGRSGTLNNQNIKVGLASKLASYWPSISYQSEDNHFGEIRFDCSTSAKDCWNNNRLNISGPVSASLAEVPMRTNLFGLFIYYQRDDEELVNYAWSNRTKEWTGTQQFAQPIPPTAPIAVMATARNQADPYNNFFALWQDTDSNIVISWRNGTGWQAPETQNAFGLALNGTNLACLTPASWNTAPIQYGHELSRCYYIGQSGGLRQVQGGPKGWRDLGPVWNMSNATS
ncbi:hypothetical protein BDV96DRAFT_690461 [Lophiotrema nucula]|uniref:Uncharacterized protein n=1 Tax=Lophiotrema nucula TaxID=690887 RepID=A0A6A5YXD1_9PLEO|nr:hypothetical protein BDV96DRAFT_690461 [Lophiotrema nucula]